jgi:pimeloyl-ACP methyl ester carboxylesterase
LINYEVDYQIICKQHRKRSGKTQNRQDRSIRSQQAWLPRVNISTRQHTVVTSHGSLAVEESGQGGVPVLLIHGNSSCRGVFRHQLRGLLAENHRLIAFDLPGHGQSSNAPDPVRSYTLPGLADAAVELLEKLGLNEAIVFGWSLGGHIGIEMIPRFAGMRGLMITGTPPVGRNNMAQGFNSSPSKEVAGKQELSEADIEAFVQAIFGESAEAFLHDAVARADGRFRKRLFEAARAGEGVDQRLVVESSPVPLAAVNGGADRIVNLDYFDTVAYANLWEGRCHRLDGLGHSPFWEAPGDFNPVLERFVGDVETSRATTRT